MTLKEQIRLALGIDSPEDTKLAYQDKLVDGTIITTEADALEAGVSVSVLTEDGTTIPLPIGKYETESGISFSVEEEGIIAEIYEEEETEEETEETTDEVETEEETEEVEASDDNAREPKKIKETTEIEFDRDTMITELSDAVKEMMSTMQTQIDELREMIEGNNTTLEEEVVAVNAEKEELSKKVAELEKAPAATPETMSKFSKEKSSTTVSKAAYNKMSSKERYWYNLSQIKN